LCDPTFTPIIKNGGFESWSGSDPNTWTGASGFSTEKVSGHSGKFAIALTTDAFGLLRQSGLVVPSGSCLCLGSAARRDGGVVDNSATIIVFTDAEFTVENAHGNYSDEHWHTQVALVDVDEGGAAYVDLSLAPTGDDPVTFSFDSIELAYQSGPCPE
jgi:hypothetical protein